MWKSADGEAIARAQSVGLNNGAYTSTGDIYTHPPPLPSVGFRSGAILHPCRCCLLFQNVAGFREPTLGMLHK